MQTIQQVEQELLSAVKDLAIISEYLIDESRPLEHRERDYQAFLIALDKASFRKLNKKSPELLKYFPEYKEM